MIRKGQKLQGSSSLINQNTPILLTRIFLKFPKNNWSQKSTPMTATISTLQLSMRENMIPILEITKEDSILQKYPRIVLSRMCRSLLTRNTHQNNLLSLF